MVQLRPNSYGLQLIPSLYHGAIAQIMANQFHEQDFELSPKKSATPLAQPILKKMVQPKWRIKKRFLPNLS